MYQKTVVIGHLGKAPEMRYTQDGTPVTGFSVATSEKWKDAQGQQQERTTWFRVTTWKKLAELCNQYLRKGSLVMVEGELSEPKPYARNDGTYAASLDLRAQVVKFLDRRAEGEQGAQVEDVEVPF